jgi:cobalt-zinc-cadmium efflux system membrane fusion protein
MKILMTFLAAILIFSGCTGDPESKEKAPGKEKKIETYRVSCQEIPSSIEATGTIQPDTEGSAKIVSGLAGTVENIFVKVGDRVKRGDPLCALRSPDVSDTYSNYLANLSQVKQAERIFNLNKQLFEVGAVTKNDLLNSEANFEQTKAQSEALKKKLEIYGVKPETGFSDRYTIHSPMEGAVVEIPAHVGDRMDTTNVLMSLADPSKVVVVANIYDTDIGHVQKGKEVTFYTDIFPNTPFKGRIKYISDSSDPDSKTIKTYIQILSEQNLFRQNMFLKIKITNGKKRFPVVPKTALLYKEGKFNVYLRAEDRNQLKEVKPVVEVGEKFMAVEGLKEGDQVVLTAIDLEKT